MEDAAGTDQSCGQEITRKPESLDDKKIVQLVSIDKAVGCPQCGSVAFGGTSCPHCRTGLLPQAEAYSQTIAKRSTFADCQTLPDLIKKFPGLTVLENNGEDALDVVSGIKNYHAQTLLRYLKEDSITPEQHTFLIQEFLEAIADKQMIFGSIINVPDELWNITDGKDIFNDVVKNITLAVAKPDGTYSLIRASNKPWSNEGEKYLEGREYYDNTEIFFTNLAAPLNGQEELNKLTSNNYKDRESMKDKIIGNQNIRYETKDYFLRSQMANSEKRKPYEDILNSMPMDREKAVDFLKKNIGGMSLTDWTDLIASQEIWFSNALADKIKRIGQMNDVDTSPIRAPLITSDVAEKIDREYLLDEFLTGNLDVKDGIAINCSSCGAPSGEFGGAAFFKCSSCGRVEDLVATGRVSKEVLGARDYEQTAVPLEYVLQLIAKEEQEDVKKMDMYPVDSKKATELLLGEVLPGESLSEREDSMLTVINALVKVLHSNPHLATSLHYFKEHYKQSGVALTINVPDDSDVNVKIPNGTNTFSIAEGIRGKVIILRFADFDSDWQKSSDSWCKFNACVVSKDEMRAIDSAEKWEGKFEGTFESGYIKDKSWLELGLAGVNIAHIGNKRTDNRLQIASGKFYELIKETVPKVPGGNDLEIILKNKTI